MMATRPFVCRFSARLLGFDDYIPAYAGASGDQLLTGVNFASAAAGIRDETGQQLVRTPYISMCFHSIVVRDPY